MVHELIASPFLGDHLVVRPGWCNAVKIPRLGTRSYGPPGRGSLPRTGRPARQGRPEGRRQRPAAERVRDRAGTVAFGLRAGLLRGEPGLQLQLLLD